MSEFNFGAVLAQAQGVTNGSNQTGDTQEYAYPLLYPPKGNTIIVRPLFNPASGQIIRLVQRHKKTTPDGKTEQIPCARTYGKPCPICEKIKEIKDVTGQDFSRNSGSKSRGVFFAQFVSSQLPVEKAGNKGQFQPGEIVLCMCPWSVYKQVNEDIQTIASNPTGMDRAFGHYREGYFLKIAVDDNFKYTMSQDPYNAITCKSNDAEFIAFLDTLPSLNDQVLTSEYTQEIETQINEYADALYREFIAPRATPSYGVPANTQPMSFDQNMATPQPQQVETPTYTQQPAPAPSNQPTCFGQHSDDNPKCICCAMEGECAAKKSYDDLPF